MADFPQRGRLLGVDMGNARIGLAVCDREQTMATPLDQLQRKTPEYDAAAFTRIVIAEEIAGLVVGLPLDINGGIGTQAQAYRVYGEWLATVVQRPVAFFDERFTTVAAEEMLWDAGLTHKKRKERRDKLAATLILQGYLENRHLTL